MAHANFEGLRILSLESRRAREVEKLIRTYKGEPFVVPAMREIPLSSNQAALDFAAGLLDGRFDLVVFTTGVGVRAFLEIAQLQQPREAVLDALRNVKIADRGAKPSAALRELKIPVTVSSDEPSTWRELLRAIDAEFGKSLEGMRVAVQEYGASNPELLAELSQRCAELTKVPVYQWALPDDLGPLRECVLGIANQTVDVVLFMTAVQVIHLFQVAEQMGSEQALRDGLNSIVVLSIGPTTSEELEHYGIKPDFEPSRPKMGFLINEAAQYAGRLLEEKRLRPPSTHAGKPGANDVSGAVARVAASTPTMAGFRNGLEQIDFLHEIDSRIAASDSLHLVLDRIVGFITSVIPCDSCFVYVLEGDRLVLRASKNPHADVVDQLDVPFGEGVTGWVAKHRKSVAIASDASNDPRFKAFKDLPEDHFEAMLCTPILCANRVIGVLNLQHRLSYHHSGEEVRLLSTLGVLVGAEVERARLEMENLELTA